MDLPCCGEFGACCGLVHRALQYIAILIHLAQLALGVDLVSAMYQQVVHNQATARAYAESVFCDCRRRHKLPLIQALKQLIAYALDQLNANLCFSGNFPHPQRFFRLRGVPPVAQIAGVGCAPGTQKRNGRHSAGRSACTVGCVNQAIALIAADNRLLWREALFL